MKPIHVSDVIQIAPESGVHGKFEGKLAFVAKVRAEYILALVVLFENVAPIRLEEHQFEFVGTAPFIPISLLSAFQRED